MTDPREGTDKQATSKPGGEHADKQAGERATDPRRDKFNQIEDEQETVNA